MSLSACTARGVRNELTNDLVQETFQNAVTKHETIPLTRPVLESSTLEKGKPFCYEARFEVTPEIKPKDYKGVEVRRRPAVVSDEALQAALEKRQEQLTELRPLPEDSKREVTESGDVWTVDVEGSIGNQRISHKEVKVDIGAPKDEVVPGLAAALSELRLTEVGTVRKLEFTPPQEAVVEKLKGAVAKLDVGLRDVRLKHVPELDDDFAKDTGEAETLEELKQKIHETLLAEDGEEAERQARHRLVASLLELNPFEPAPSMVNREVAAQVERAKQMLQMQGLSLSSIGTNEQRLATQMRSQATFNVKAFLLLEAISKAEGIDVPDDELAKEVENVAQERGQNVDRIRATMEKSGELMMLRAQIKEQKILDFLMEAASVTEAPDPEPEETEADGGVGTQNPDSEDLASASTGESDSPSG